MRHAFQVVPVIVVAGMLGLMATSARADDAADAKKGVEAFVNAWQSGDAKAMQGTLVIPAGKEKDIGTILEAVSSMSRLQKTALDKFGSSATEYFADASGQFAIRMKAIKEGPIKFSGDTAVLTIPADEAAKTRGGTLLLVKKGTAWKIDAGTLFDVTPNLVSSSAKLSTVADQMSKEIAAGKYSAAVDAYQEFNARYAAALKGATTGATSAPAAESQPRKK